MAGKKSSKKSKRKVTALVLQGGGALGAFEYGVIKTLYREKGIRPDIVAGVSIGGINASVLVGSKKSDPVDALGELWEEFSVVGIPFVPRPVSKLIHTLKNPSIYTLDPQLLYAPYAATGICDFTPLEKTLEKYIDLSKLNSGRPQLSITAMNIGTGRVQAFTSGEDEISIDHIIASGSFPPFFDPRPIGDACYWDGAVFSNTPMRSAFNLIEAVGGADEELEREIIVVELFPHRGPIPKNLEEVGDRLLEIGFQNRLEQDQNQYKKMSGFIDLIKEIDKKISSDPNLKKRFASIRRRESYQSLLEHKKIKLTVIDHPGKESLYGPADFTHDVIKRRIERGEQRARECLG